MSALVKRYRLSSPNDVSIAFDYWPEGYRWLDPKTQEFRCHPLIEEVEYCPERVLVAVLSIIVSSIAME